MAVREKILRFNLIIGKLRREAVTYDELYDYLKIESEIQGYNFVISQRTLQRDIKEIYSLYNIEIKNDKGSRLYRIVSSEEPEIDERILEAFDIFNVFNISDRISDFVHFEKRRSKGTENLYGLIHAIKHRFQVSYTYNKYWDNSSSVRKAEPYALKEFRGRWYLLAKDIGDGHIKTFALDRLSTLNITNRKFKPPRDFSVNEFYKHSFGIITTDDDPAEIILSFTPFQGKYIKSLPLHESQEILIDNDKEFRVKLKMIITHDLYMELLSLGDNMRVIAPESLISDMKSTLENTLKLYKSSKE